MKLRVKLFIPLLLFSLLFGLYVRLLWLPNTADSMLQQSNRNWNNHLTSVAEGLIPLLLENQLANVYENLDALLQQNKNWLSIELADNTGKRIYPLGKLPDPGSFPSHVQTSHLAVGFADPALAQLKVTRDINPLLSDINEMEQRLTLVLLLLLLIFMLFIGSTLEWQVRRRLTKLSNAAKRLSNGDYKAGLPEQSQDEIGDLTNAFNSMRDALAVYHRQLQGEIDNHRRTAEALEEEKERVTYQATHDPLTGLINRREFERRLAEVLRQADIDGSHHVLLYMDLDQFKIVNDTCGHIAGDTLLQQIRITLQERIRQNDSLARLGGDEFGVLLKHCTQDDALKVAESLRQAILNFHFVWEDKTFRVGISIGAVGIDRHSGDISSLLSAADSACYMAKERGRNRVQLYKKTDQDLARQHGDMLWITRITEALNRDLFELYCHPIVAVAPTRVEQNHYEILVRLRQKNSDLIPPGAFIPAAERFDMITLVDRWVVDHAFDYLKQHQQEKRLRFSINLSGKSLSDKGLLEHIEKRIIDGDVEGHEICFEITESAAVISLGTARRFIQSLKAYGCYFSLDDFGRGMSSFSYLKTLPVDYIKIDGSFISDIVIDSLGRAIVNSINQIAHTLKLQTIAEFVEDQATLEELQRLQIDYAQGFHICKPFPISELSKHVEWKQLDSQLTDPSAEEACKLSGQS
ncbi:MAG: EAL domain-containing protein [Candidatus Thiodiazotropha sp.]